MSLNTIKRALRNFGLTEKEAEIYVFLAKYGVLSGGEISKLTKTHRPHMYRLLQNLQKKGVIQSTLESPVRYFSVPFEKILDENIKLKQEEATSLEKAKNGLLSDWKNIYSVKIEPDLGKFAVIEGNRKIYSKIYQMIKETKSQLSAISTVTGLERAEQFGVFDAAYNHPFKSKIKFRFLTELSKQNLKATKLLMPKLKSDLNLKAINSDPNFALSARMVIRDDEEALFFISPKPDMFKKGQDEACLVTNCQSLIEMLARTFEDLWKHSAHIEDRILEIETGKLLPEPFLDKSVEIAANYNAALSTVREQVRSLPLLTAQLTKMEHSLPEMVGREEELKQLERALQQVLEGIGNTIIISGEAGIGKTRLANELMLYALSHNLRVLKCDCTHEPSIPLSPFRKILGDLFNVSKEDTPETRRDKISNQIKETAPRFQLAIPFIENFIARSPMAAKAYEEETMENEPDDMASLFQSEEGIATLSHLLVSFSEKQPIMLFIDDLHHADSSSLKLFQRLSKAIQKSNLFLGGAYRREALNQTEGMAHPLVDTLESMSRDALFKKIELKRLSLKDCLRLVNNVLDIEDDELGRRIYAETEGNPFFVLETLKFLINSKLLVIIGDKWKLTKDVKEIEIPPKVRDVISRRIRLLGEEERDILDCASIVGEEFSTNLIERVTGLDRLRLLKRLNNVERKYQLIHSFDGKYRFDHAKIREVLYQEMSLELRKEYHSLVADKIEETFKENPREVANSLAYHYFASGNGQKAIPYLLQSAQRARREWAIFETIQHYSQALQLMGDDEKWSRELTETLETLGGLYGLAAEHEKANECYQKGIASTNDEAAKDRMRRKIRRKKTVENDGVKLAYYLYGEGEPTIFLLAWTSTAELWIPQVTYFSQKHKVVTMDMRGTGESDKPLEEYTLDMYVDDLKSVIDDLQDKNVIFVGSFIGGKIAVKYVANYPEKISKLVLLSFNPAPASERPDFDRKAFEENRERVLKTPYLGVKRFWEMTIPDPRFESLREWGLKSSEKTPPEIFVKSLHNLSKEDVRPSLERIKVPTLILNGDKTVYALENVKYLKERIPGSKAFIFKGLGLCFLNIIAAKQFNKIVEDFIKTGETKN